jgi:hypothetical protein
MPMASTVAAPRLVLVPVAKTSAPPVSRTRAVRRYRLARMKLPPLPAGTEHLRRAYD